MNNLVRNPLFILHIDNFIDPQRFQLGFGGLYVGQIQYRCIAITRVTIAIFDELAAFTVFQLMVDTNDIVIFGIDIRARGVDIAADVTIEALLPQNIIQQPTIGLIALDY
jgi:hypothetical protein